jgi:hypothetical protein
MAVQPIPATENDENFPPFFYQCTTSLLTCGAVITVRVLVDGAAHDVAPHPVVADEEVLVGAGVQGRELLPPHLHLQPATAWGRGEKGPRSSVQGTNTGNWKQIFPEKKLCAATVPISTFMCL